MFICGMKKDMMVKIAMNDVIIMPQKNVIKIIASPEVDSDSYWSVNNSWG